MFAGGWTLTSAGLCATRRRSASTSSRASPRWWTSRWSPPRPPPATSVHHAGDDPRVRAGAAGGAGELEPVTRRHAEHFLALAVAAEPHLTGPARPVAGPLRPGARQPPRRPAVGRGGRRDRPGPGGGGGDLEVLAAARPPDRGPALARGALLALPSGRDRQARAKALAGAGGIAWWQEDIAAARGFYSGPGHRAGWATPAGIAQALYNQAFVVGRRGRLRRRLRLFDESRELARQAGTSRPRPERVDAGHRDLGAGAWTGPWPSPSRPWTGGAGSGTASRWATASSGWPWSTTRAPPAGARPPSARPRLFREVDSPMGIVSVILGLSYLARWEGRYHDGPPGRRRRFPARPGRRQAAPRLPRRLRRRPRGRGPGLPEDVAEAAWRRRAGASAWTRPWRRRHPAAPDADRPAGCPPGVVGSTAFADWRAHGQGCHAGVDVAGRVHRRPVGRGRAAVRLVRERRRRVHRGRPGPGVPGVGGERGVPEPGVGETPGWG